MTAYPLISARPALVCGLRAHRPPPGDDKLTAARTGAPPMYRSSNYPTDPAAVEAFVAEQRHGYLIATPPGGYPSVSILPFVKDGDRIELHCVQEDPTF